jgi:hypothetical protein
MPCVFEEFREKLKIKKIDFWDYIVSSFPLKKEVKIKGHPEGKKFHLFGDELRD